ncbi:PREDICTED: uncharacterized protein LOC105363644 [Ceratosolen solmsi marchali]|uniref:Uncharacterized protein LOC105363644 n=1 Tax=Ceratosolen solmsi marchali TaxID=326594 RepID=A0AAJ6YKE8_9HYME|nr:PREDICTED: uncharacterized protein LOC105363644 [Ceratosolen solmsi marchali]
MFTVPECVGGRCSCDAMLDALPIPVVTVINPYNGGTLINWKIKSTKLTTDHKQFNIKSFAISAGIPYITSSSDEVLYNKTLIFSGKADNNSFYWKQEKLKKGTKIFVTAQDSYGCSGREGTYTIKRLRHHSFYRKNIATVIFAGLVVLCLMLSGLFNFIQYCLENHKYKLCSWRKKSTRKLSSIFHKPKIEILLRNENTLYIDKKIEVLS